MKFYSQRHFERVWVRRLTKASRHVSEIILITLFFYSFMLIGMLLHEVIK